MSIPHHVSRFKSAEIRVFFFPTTVLQALPALEPCQKYQFEVILWGLFALANIIQDADGTRVVPHHYFHITTKLHFALT